VTSAYSLFSKQCQRELLIQVRQIRFLLNSCLFLLIFLFMFPLTLKPEITLLRTVAPGLVWMAILLSLLLSGQSLPMLVSAKIIAHWVLNLIPLLILCPLIALLFSLTAWETTVLALTIICGTPALLFLCALVAAFGVGINQRGVLMALILLPLTLPLLVFGSGTLHVAMQGLPISGYLALLLAMSVIAVGFLPYAIAAVIKVSHAE
jgi:heme exporter protein B